MLRFPVADSHVHTDCSIDAKGSVAEFCRKALELGLHEITFVVHYEMTPAARSTYGYMVFDDKRVPSGPDTVKRFAELIRRAGEDYFPLGLKVLCGLEVGWHREIAEHLQRELPTFDLDLTIGSVHELSGTHFAASAQGNGFFRSHRLEEWLPAYFTAMEELAESELFDVLAHIDLYKRLGLSVYGERLRQAHKPHLGSLFRKMIRHQLGLEVNTSGIRHGINEYYPSFEILNEARHAGVEIKTLGSDAHAPEQLALDFETAAPIVHELLPCTLGKGDES